MPGGGFAREQRTQVGREGKKETQYMSGGKRREGDK